ncbi:LemA family protein [Candidatus Micrarchaeota archaeon]|nr:LemA family protein [Candidatus Micrarchaeota archaeon]
MEDFFGDRANRAIYWSCLLISIGLSAVFLGINFYLKLPLAVLFFIQFGVIAFLFSKIYNRIVLLFQRAKDALSQIDIQSKRRADLVPAMNQLVVESGKYEKGVLEDVAKIRLATLNPFNAENGAQLLEKQNVRLKEIIAVAEKYPKLKANQNYKAMMQTLIDSERRIAYARSFYNRTVLKYNTLLSTFPGDVFSVFGFRSMQYFEFK